MYSRGEGIMSTTILIRTLSAHTFTTLDVKTTDNGRKSLISDQVIICPTPKDVEKIFPHIQHDPPTDGSSHNLWKFKKF
jgi:hypothetical protein